MASDSAPPPAYEPTIYDETLRSKFYMNPTINSTANRPTLLGRLKHYAPTTDGSFSICVASGEGVFISQVCSHNLYIISSFSHKIERHCSSPFLSSIVPLSTHPTRINQLTRSSAVFFNPSERLLYLSYSPTWTPEQNSASFFMPSLYRICSSICLLAQRTVVTIWSQLRFGQVAALGQFMGSVWVKVMK